LFYSVLFCKLNFIGSQEKYGLKIIYIFDVYEKKYTFPNEYLNVKWIQLNLNIAPSFKG
jgi:hypothetical protein